MADFSADEHSGVPEAWRGTYLGFVPEDTTLDGDGVHPTCLNYLKGLGVTHVQLQPIFDYATVDETKPGGYNWGYDPLNYNVPEGSFSTDPCHGEVRVRECRAMVQALHRAGLGVVMDVVYNHTYHTDSWLEHTVPGYWNRSWPDGRVTNGSGCGNDLASERPMVRKYLVDSVVYWAKEYHIDGFRFDLMALEDVDTMNAIRAALDELPGGRDILMYGEPWTGGSTNLEGGARPSDKRALDALSDRIGFFCDDTRDAVKGNVFDAGNAGYVNGAPQCGYDVLHAVGAWRSGVRGFRPRQAMQVVQYVSAHDNYTLWDKLAAVARCPDYDAAPAELLAQNRMAAGICLTCQGMPFLQAGEEFGRTKYGDHNSYRGPLATNRLDWRRAHRPEFAALTAYYRGMLAIRRAFPRLSGAAGEPEPFLLALPGVAHRLCARDRGAPTRWGSWPSTTTPNPPASGRRCLRAPGGGCATAPTPVRRPSARCAGTRWNWNPAASRCCWPSKGRENANQGKRPRCQRGTGPPLPSGGPTIWTARCRPAA